MEYCVVDVETTGLDLRRDSIVSFGAVCVVDGRVRVGDCAYQIVRPGCDVSMRSVCIHGLRPADLADAPSQAEALPVLADLLDGRVLVAHAAWIERAFLSRAFRRIGTRLVGPVVDTAGLVRAAGLDREALPGHEPSLERTAVSVGLEPHSPHHAIGDALTTAELMLVMAVRLRAVTVADLVYPDDGRVGREHHVSRDVTA
ncbi:MAG: PolC-type DNA polymerase III [Actinomycetes bacterium]